MAAEVAVATAFGGQPLELMRGMWQVGEKEIGGRRAAVPSDEGGEQKARANGPAGQGGVRCGHGHRCHMRSVIVAVGVISVFGVLVSWNADDEL